MKRRMTYFKFKRSIQLIVFFCFVSNYGTCQPGCDQPAKSFVRLYKWKNPLYEMTADIDDKIKKICVNKTVIYKYSKKESKAYYDIPISRADENDTLKINIETQEKKIELRIKYGELNYSLSTGFGIWGLPEKSGVYFISLEQIQAVNCLGICCYNITPENWDAHKLNQSGKIEFMSSEKNCISNPENLDRFVLLTYYRDGRAINDFKIHEKTKFANFQYGKLNVFYYPKNETYNDSLLLHTHDNTEFNYVFIDQKDTMNIQISQLPEGLNLWIDSIPFQPGNYRIQLAKKLGANDHFIEESKIYNPSLTIENRFPKFKAEKGITFTDYYYYIQKEHKNINLYADFVYCHLESNIMYPYFADHYVENILNKTYIHVLVTELKLLPEK